MSIVNMNEHSAESYTRHERMQGPIRQTGPLLSLESNFKESQHCLDGSYPVHAELVSSGAPEIQA